MVNDWACGRASRPSIGTGPTIYPNKFWADFTLTPEGKKLVKLPEGWRRDQWRPDSAVIRNMRSIVDDRRRPII